MTQSELIMTIEPDGTVSEINWYAVEREAEQFQAARKYLNPLLRNAQMDPTIRGLMCMIMVGVRENLLRTKTPEIK